MKLCLRMQASMYSTMQKEFIGYSGIDKENYVKALCLMLIDEVTAEGSSERQNKLIEYVENALSEMKYVNGEAGDKEKNREIVNERSRLERALKKLPKVGEDE